MSTMNRDELERAIAYVKDYCDEKAHLNLVLNAARAHLATLPKKRKETIRCWVVRYSNGNIAATTTEDEVRCLVRGYPGSTIHEMPPLEIEVAD